MRWLATILALVTAALLAAGAIGKPTRPAPKPDLGAGADLKGRRPFPADNAWNRDVSKEAVDPNSDRLIASIGIDAPLHPDFGTRYGIPYVVVERSQPRVPVAFEYAGESDRGPYPIPPDAPIEGGADASGDRHVLVIDRDEWRLYELWAAYPQEGGRSWKAGSGAIFDLSSNKTRPAGWTSADAAGLAVFPGLVRYDEVVLRKVVEHAFRFTCVKTRRAYVSPASHFASRVDDENLPPMGMRVRLKAAFDTRGFPESARVILEAMKTYGLILADNGSNWFVTGAPDPRFRDAEIETLKKVKGRDFEVVKMGEMVKR